MQPVPPPDSFLLGRMRHRNQDITPTIIHNLYQLE
jgi:hypothetical protein